jgi:uncharacterized protein (DUF2235 family)
VLSDDTTTKFRAALREHCADAAGLREGMKAAVRALAAEARGAGMTAEQLVIWIKQLWDAVAEEGALARNVDPLRARDNVISSAIRAYYVQ